MIMDNDKEPKEFQGKLTVVLRDDAPLVCCDAPSAFRSVSIEFTDEQRAQLALRWTNRSGDKACYESVSQCFIED